MASFGNSPASTLIEENQAAHALLQLLKQEQEQLIAANIEQLTALTEEKSKIVARMSDLASGRHAALAVAGFEAQETGMQAWLKKTADNAVRKSWTELLALAKSAKEINRTNGMLINKHMTRTQTALNVLNGGSQANAFYGPDGQSSVKATTRGLVIG